jgi:hypothetical protein
LGDIVEHWARFGRDEATGQWTHPDDRAVLAGQHSFNLDYPTCPYLGPVTSAKVVILGANGGYSPIATPDEFPDAEAFERYLGRIRDPESADWSNVSPYYDRVNYGPLVYRGDAVWVNASPYRSPRISAEPDNQRLVGLLPTSAFIRRWVFEAVLPLAAHGERLVVVKRPGLWRLPQEVKTAMGVIVDPAPISPQLTSAPWNAVQDFLSGGGLASSARSPGAQGTAGQTPTTAEPGEPEARRKRRAADAISAGTPQSQVSPLVRVCEALGLKLIDPEAAWPGYGKVVHLDDERSIYINRTNADVRSSPAEVAAWQKAGLGTARPDNDRYLRVTLA